MKVMKVIKKLVLLHIVLVLQGYFIIIETVLTYAVVIEY